MQITQEQANILQKYITGEIAPTNEFTKYLVEQIGETKQKLSVMKNQVDTANKQLAIFQRELTFLENKQNTHVADLQNFIQKESKDTNPKTKLSKIPGGKEKK